jgi:two-component system response regulator DevR
MPTAPAPISILIVDDSELVRTGLRTLLGNLTQAGRFNVVGEAESVASAIAETNRLRPSVVLLDIRLPDGSGLEACREILAIHPETKVLVLTSVIDDGLIYEALSKGAHGYLLKEIDAQGLFRAIVDVAAGRFILDPTLTTRVLNLVRAGTPKVEPDKLASLSAQERRVLALVAEGQTNREIAGQMGLSDKTVKNYLSNIFEKLQITRRSQAAVLYSESRSAGRSARP